MSYNESHKKTVANTIPMVFGKEEIPHFPDEGLCIGSLHFYDKQIPALIDLFTNKGICFLYNTDKNRDIVNRCLEKVIWRIALCLPTNLCEFIVYNGGNPGDNFNTLNKLANGKKGDVTVGTVINLKEVTFGEHSLKNVRASVVRNQKAPLLLGQSVLGRLGKIEIDNAKIINSNKYAIKAMVEDAGATVSISHAGDTFEEVRDEVLKASKDYDVIMTTGGTAISKGDVVLDVVDDLGEILFHGVAIRPGKPIGAGIVNDKMIFTFSGQPVAAMSQFDIFARKYLFKMQGRDFDFHIVQRQAKLKIPSQLGRTDFIRAFSDDEFARHVLNRGSGIIRSMVEANSYIIIDENDEGYQKDDIVDVVFFDSLLW